MVATIKKSFIAIPAILLVFVAFIFSNICSSNYAYADDAEDLKAVVAEFNDAESSIKALQNEYLTAVRIESELSAQIEVLEKDLRDVETKIDQHQKTLSKAFVSKYKEPSVELLVDVVLNSESIEDARRNWDYMVYVLNYESKIVAELENLQAEQELKTLEVSEKKRTLEDQKIHLASVTEQLEKNKKELSGKIDTLRTKLAAVSADKASKEQMENILNYLNSVGNLTETQEAIIRSAYSTPYAGGNLCEAWAEQVYRNAGVPVPLLESAIAGKEKYFVSDSTENIPPGAWVYGSGVGYMGSLYGHVGIYVGNGLIMDNEGSRTKQAVPIEQWVSWQTASQNGKSGWYGWGYPGGLDFNPEL